MFVGKLIRLDVMQEKKKQHLSAEKIHMIDSVANIADKVYKDKGKSEKKIDL